MSSMLPGPGGYSIFIPTGEEVDWKKLIEDDPFYKQDQTWIAEDKKKAETRLAEDKLYSQGLYNMNVQQAQASANSGGDYGLGAAQAQAALAKEKAAHDNANRAEYLNEWLASRGMGDSGQKAWEQNERTYQFDMYNKGIDADLAGRAAAAAGARAEAQARLSSQLQEMQFRNDRTLLEFARDEEDLPGTFARQSGQAGFAAYNRLKDAGKLNPGEMALWDPESQLYVTKDGRYFDGTGRATSWSRNTGGGGGGDVGGGIIPSSPTELGPSYDTQWTPTNTYGQTPFFYDETAAI